VGVLYLLLLYTGNYLKNSVCYICCLVCKLINFCLLTLYGYALLDIRMERHIEGVHQASEFNLRNFSTPAMRNCGAASKNNAL